MFSGTYVLLFLVNFEQVEWYVGITYYVHFLTSVSPEIK
jgi:hypothetical protein